MRAVRRLLPASPLQAAMAALPALSLLLVGLLAYEAWSAERSRGAAEEAAVREQAKFAAAQAARSLRSGIINNSRETVWQAVYRLSPPAELSAAEQAKRGEMEPLMFCPGCPAEDSATRFFRADLARGEVTSDRPLGAAERAWILRTVRERRESHPLGFHERTHFGRVGRRVWGMGYIVRGDSLKPPATAYGYLTPPGAFRGAVRHVESLYPLLPGGRALDSLVSYTARDADGNVVLRSGRPHRSAYTARDTTGGIFGGLVVEAALHPRAGRVLLPGGQAGSRLPHIAALLVLACALGGGALLQRRRERQLTRLRTDFIANLSHELNTPVAQISLFAETLLLGLSRSEEERRRSLEIIFRESVRLSQSVRNVLFFTQSSRRAEPPALRPARLDDEVRAAVSTFAPLARAHGVEVVPVLEPVAARAAPDGFRLLLLNLLDNAVKYGPRGQRVRVDLRLDGALARLSVEDQGPGIPPADRERVWQPFERLDREPERVKGGSGIGLPVVRAVVEQHGARAWVEDGAGGGARFVVELPGASRVEAAAGV